MIFGNFSISLMALGLCCVIIAARLRFRKKKSAAERERERRLAVNAIGRFTEGSITEGDSLNTDSPDRHLLFYRYRVAGVEYSAAQDITSLRHIIPAGCILGTTAIVKYDPHNPSNSILVCELWSGLPDVGLSAKSIQKTHSMPQRETTLAN